MLLKVLLHIKVVLSFSLNVSSVFEKDDTAILSLLDAGFNRVRKEIYFPTY